jgi:ankyrin repeat protein
MSRQQALSHLCTLVLIVATVLLFRHLWRVRVLEPELVRAAGLNNTAMVRACLDRGADVNAQGTFGTVQGKITPLEISVYREHPSVVQLLLEHGADVRLAEPMVDLIRDPRIVSLLIAHGAWPGATLPWWVEYKKAAASEVVEHLVETGTEVNERDGNGNTALHIIAQRIEEPDDIPCFRVTWREAAECLLAHGADVNVRNKRGQTPLDVADAYSHHDFATLLKSHGAHR